VVRQSAPASLVDQLRAWTYRRQLLDHAAAGPEEALRAAIAVYSAHPSGPLSLLARSSPFAAHDFGELERRRKAVRIVGMRGSAFLVPAEQAARIFAATRPSAGTDARLRALGLTRAQYDRLKPRILEAADDPITPKELERRLDADRSAVFAMRTMAREGLILRIGWDDQVRTDRLRWVATQAWLGHPLEADADQSLTWLAGEYLRAYGPARVADFAWWAGVVRRRADAALRSVKTVVVEPDLLLREEDEASWKRTKPVPARAVDVLPKWDAYTMAHAPDGRARLVADAHLTRAYSTTGSKVGATSGDGMPLILRGGRAVATWQHRLEGRTMLVAVDPLPGVRQPATQALQRAFEPVGELLERAVNVA
jgi:Winged helix DNA-binding domain